MRAASRRSGRGSGDRAPGRVPFETVEHVAQEASRGPFNRISCIRIRVCAPAPRRPPTARPRAASPPSGPAGVLPRSCRTGWCRGRQRQPALPLRCVAFEVGPQGLGIDLHGPGLGPEPRARIETGSQQAGSKRGRNVRCQRVGRRGSELRRPPHQSRSVLRRQLAPLARGQLVDQSDGGQPVGEGSGRHGQAYHQASGVLGPEPEPTDSRGALSGIRNAAAKALARFSFSPCLHAAPKMFSSTWIPWPSPASR